MFTIIPTINNYYCLLIIISPVYNRVWLKNFALKTCFEWKCEFLRNA